MPEIGKLSLFLDINNFLTDVTAFDEFLNNLMYVGPQKSFYIEFICCLELLMT